MTARAEAGKPAQIRFTRDWHELLSGELRPTMPLILHYDPARIVPEGDGYMFGDPKRPITAWLDFGPGVERQAITLHSPAGMLPHPHHDATGHRSMLHARVDVPAQASGVTVSFSYLGHSGTLHRDDDLGKQYHFGFAVHDIAVREARVVEPGAAAPARFALRVATHADVSAVRVRFRVIDRTRTEAQEADLRPSDEREADGWCVWLLDGTPVPSGATLRYKLYYWRGGTRLKDDNAGHYYLAPPPPPEPVPPPPDELGRASMRW